MIAALVYLTAVFHRSSLGVAGLEATHRFHIGAGQLSVFVLLQVGVYAAMQVPTGVLVDRYGPRRLLTVAAALMGVAQLIFAVAPSYPMALAARALLGAGDALTFVSVLRFAALHFNPRQYPMIVAVTAVLGSVGNVLATVPLSLALHSAGWTPTFGVTAMVSAGAALAVWSLVPDNAPTLTPLRLSELGPPIRRVGARVCRAWATPGTRLGFWVHFASMSTTTVFTLLWGVPYLVAIGFSQSAASAVLLVCVAMAVIAGPPIGMVIGRRPSLRVPIAIGVCVSTAVGWLVLLELGGSNPPIAPVVLLVVFAALGGPVSAIGFALARDYNEPSMVGTATGVVNVGGFVAAIVGSAIVGATLEVRGGSSAGDYRVAFAAMLLVQVVGIAQLVRWWRRARAVAIRRQRQGLSVPVRVVARGWDLVSDAELASLGVSDPSTSPRV
ncbi:MAG: MFS transporter [Actinobacteria bacterium]|nr:MFS transporter [Actinomycetota bacterium]